MKNLSKEISLIFEKRRSEALHNADLRKQEVYAKVPALEEIDYKIKLLGIEMSRLALSGNAADIQQIKSSMTNLRDKRSALLSQNSIDPVYLCVKHCCERCADTGFITENTSSTRCSCYRTLVVENLYKSLTLDPNRTMTFDRFDISLYPDSPDETGVSPRNRMKKNYNVCREFTERFADNDIKNILIYGQTGIGKTFMCGCIANALTEKAIPVIYISSIDLFDIITDSKFERSEYSSDKPNIEDLVNAELLIIDDLGTESLTDFRKAEFLEILNKKKEINGVRPCRMIITTNLSPKEIYSKYSERIGSRISSEFTGLKFVGKDIRMIDK